MPAPSAKTYISAAAIICACFATAFGLNAFLESKRPQVFADYVDSDLHFNGSRVKGFLFGAEGLMADWYFMRALQYIGNKMLAAKDQDIDLEDLTNLNPRLLYPMLENATDLDPHFMAAYSYGAMVLPAIDKQQAIKLMRKGIEHNPEKWRLYQYLGYVHWRLGEFDLAAEAYEKGSRLEGSSPFMEMMVAGMKARGGSRDTARAMYQEMEKNPDDEYIRLTGKRRLLQLDSLDDRDAIDAILNEQKEKTSRCPARFTEIFPLLRNVRLPGGRQFRVDAGGSIVDPSGVPYLLDTAACRTILDRERTSIATQ